MAPLVSCIMPTRDRPALVSRAIGFFLRQTYANTELIVVDDGSQDIGDVASMDPRIRYLRLGAPQSIGTKRNVACELARGDLIAHWDDDDWYAPHRLGYQVEQLGDGEVC